MMICLALALLALTAVSGYDVLIECDCTCTGALSAGQCSTIAQTCGTLRRNAVIIRPLLGTKQN